MTILSPIEQSIFNAGERLIPGVTHTTSEVVRHKSSYVFFRKVIESDAMSGLLTGKTHIRILDIGCGVGHGTYMLANIRGAVLTGIDCSEESIVYAREHYGQDNITYFSADAISFINNMPEFDYVVSRHALEHIPDGINVAAKSKFAMRLMVNVPFAEAEGNPHHHVHDIREDTFAFYENREIFFEGSDGVTFGEYPTEVAPNSIICISSRAPFPKVRSRLDFPILPWQPEYLQKRWLEIFNQQGDIDLIERELSRRECEVASRDKLLNEHDDQLKHRKLELEHRELDLGHRKLELEHRELELGHRELELEKKLQTYEKLMFVRLYRRITSFLKLLHIGN